jgi:hypothetical protein
MDSRLRESISMIRLIALASTSGGEMSEIRPEPYEAPSVEEVEVDGESIAAAPSVLASAA